MSTIQAQVWKPWLNHSTNWAAGWTLTVPAAHGALIATALAVVVALAGDAAWTITAFALHQYRARAGPQTALFRMQQVALRNAGGPIASALDLARIGFARRRWALFWTFFGECKIAIVPLFIKVVFVVAAVLVGLVGVAPYKVNTVLLEPTECGIFYVDSLFNLSTTQSDFSTKQRADLRRGRAYASQCYRRRNIALACTGFKVQELPYQIRGNVTCPFGGMCLTGPAGAFQVGTGLLSSQHHLGINSPERDRVDFEVVTSCSPIHTEPYTTIVTVQDGIGDSSIWQVGFGPTGDQNYTYTFDERQRLGENGYVTRAIGTSPNASTETGYSTLWKPIPELDQADADTTVIFMTANQVFYSETVRDPWFSANGSKTVKTEDGKLWYASDKYFTAMACAERIRFCFANHRCMPLAATTTTWDTYPSDLSTNQATTVERILSARWNSQVVDVVSAFGNLAVAASDLTSMEFSVERAGNVLSSGLPEDQWQIEVSKWFETSLATLQYQIADYPTNEWYSNNGEKSSKHLELRRELDAAGLPTLAGSCSRQLARSTAQYQSFSLSGLVIVIVMSFSLLLVSWTMETCVLRRRDRKSPDAPKHHKLVAHLADGKPQLLRMALKSAGYLNWQDEDSEYPHRIGGRADAGNGDFEADIMPAIMEDGAVLVSGSVFEMDNLVARSAARRRSDSPHLRNTAKDASADSDAALPVHGAGNESALDASTILESTRTQSHIEPQISAVPSLHGPEDSAAAASSSSLSLLAGGHDLSSET